MRTYCVARDLYSRCCGDLNRKEILEREYIYICITDSFCWTVETNNIVEQLYFNKNELIICLQIKVIQFFFFFP